MFVLKLSGIQYTLQYYNGRYCGKWIVLIGQRDYLVSDNNERFLLYELDCWPKHMKNKDKKLSIRT